MSHEDQQPVEPVTPSTVPPVEPAGALPPPAPSPYAPPAPYASPPVGGPPPAFPTYGEPAPPSTLPQPPGDPVRGVLAGLGVAVLGAALWALLVYLTHYEVGIIAVVVGVAVGWTVHRVGRVAWVGLAAVSALVAAAAIYAGFVLAELVGGAVQLGIGVFDAVDIVTHQIGWGTFLGDAVTGMDWLFLAIGAFSAFRLVAQQRRR